MVNQEYHQQIYHALSYSLINARLVAIGDNHQIPTTNAVQLVAHWLHYYVRSILFGNGDISTLSYDNGVQDWSAEIAAYLEIIKIYKEPQLGVAIPSLRSIVNYVAQRNRDIFFDKAECIRPLFNRPRVLCATLPGAFAKLTNCDAHRFIPLAALGMDQTEMIDKTWANTIYQIEHFIMDADVLVIQCLRYLLRNRPEKIIIKTDEICNSTASMDYWYANMPYDLFIGCDEQGDTCSYIWCNH